MNLQDRIVTQLMRYKQGISSVEDCAKAILALVDGLQGGGVEGKKSKCCGQPTVLTKSGESFCGGWKGCGKWCEVVEDTPVEPTAPAIKNGRMGEFLGYEIAPDEMVTLKPTAPVGGSWESEFDEMFVSEEGFVKPQRDAFYPAYEIKDFIRQTIKNREREIVEHLDSLTDTNDYSDPKWSDDTRNEAEGWNAAIRAVRVFINKQ